MRPHFPIELVVDEVRLAVAAQIPVDARRTNVRARHAVRGAELGWDDSDRARALLEDRVADHEILELVTRREDLVHRGLALGDKSPRQIILDAADAIEVRVEA